jgi:hypothetical protein
MSAFSPKNVFFWLRSQPSRQSARAIGASAKQAKASGISKANGQYAQFVEGLNRKVVFICPNDRKKSAEGESAETVFPAR